ncbi:hypothetical protein J437_LFUL007169 [Ladona fulva]|uniref:Uncharacterized protein n=1 Tax=Ladona fulva TaxID=123851 RepID=A0A8K0K804_LADFU|nr:hypothetical protein J437_LFUL007169 [Ladona fulva]
MLIHVLDYRLSCDCRSAARFNKAIKVLCCVSVKASFTLVLEVFKGAVKANECLQKVKSMLHCSFCEDWAFLPNSQYPLDAPASLLRCDCRHKCPGKTACCVGPIWSGPIFCTDFISSIIDKLSAKKKTPNSVWQSTASLLSLVLEEAHCRGRRPSTLKRENEDGNERECKRMRNSDWKPNESTESICVEKSPKPNKVELHQTPPFYFSLHQRHSGRGRGRVPRADAAVIRLREADFCASRTHFDPCAIRTNAPPTEIWRLLGMM